MTYLLAVLVLAALVASEAVAQPADNLTGTALVALAKARSDFRKPDAFAPVMNDHALAGRAFRIVMPFSEGGAQDPIWSYDAARGKLTLEYEQRAADAEFSTGVSGAWGLRLSSHATFAGSDVQENAFGVKVKVQKFATSAVILGGQGDPPTTGLQPGLSTTVSADGEAARTIATKGYAVFIGRLTDLNDAGVTDCGTTAHEPTISSPIESAGDVCVIGAAVEKIEFHAADGALLDAWPHPS